MVWVAGADGCRQGWLRASRETATAELRFDLIQKVDELLAQAPGPTLVALDMPTSSSVAGGSKLKSVLMFRHMEASRGRG